MLTQPLTLLNFIHSLTLKDQDNVFTLLDFSLPFVSQHALAFLDSFSMRPLTRIIFTAVKSTCNDLKFA